MRGHVMQRFCCFELRFLLGVTAARLGGSNIGLEGLAPTSENVYVSTRFAHGLTVNRDYRN